MKSHNFIGTGLARIIFVSFLFLLPFLPQAAHAQPSAEQTQSTSNSVQPAELSPVALRKLEALKLILEDADSSKDSGQRVKFLNEFMGKSELFLNDNPEATNVWMLRARVAVDLDMAKEGWAAGQRLKALGAEKSNNEEMIRTLAKLERKGWLVEKLENVKAESPPQNPTLFPAEKDGKWGFIDTKGNIVIPMKFEHADIFSEGLAAAKQNGKYGYIDPAGTFVIEPQFDAAFRFTEGIGRVASGLKFIIPIFYHAEEEENYSISYFTPDGTVRGNWSFIDRSGKRLFNRTFSWAFPFSEGIAVIRDGDEWQAVDESGQTITQTKYEGLGEVFKEGVCSFSQKKAGSEDSIQGCIDKHGNVVIEPKFSRLGEFSEGLAPARLIGSGLSGYINHSSEFVIASQFDGCGKFSQGLALVSLPKSGRYAVIDKTGNFVGRPSKKIVTSGNYPFSDGLCAACIDPGLSKRVNGVIQLGSEVRYGFINQSGEIIIPPVFDYVSGFKNGLALVNVGGNRDGDDPKSIGGKWGYIDKVGRPIWNLDGVIEERIGELKTGDYVPTGPK